MLSVSTATNVNANIVLCRGWCFTKRGDEIRGAEKNFSIPVNYFDEVMNLLFPFEETLTFLDIYEPCIQGKIIYERAKKDNKIIEEGEDL